MPARAHRPPAGTRGLGGSATGRRAAADGRRDSGRGPAGRPVAREPAVEGRWPPASDPRAARDGAGVARPAAGRVDGLKRAAGRRAACLRRDPAILLRPVRRDGPPPGAPLEPGSGKLVVAAWPKRHPERRRRRRPAGRHESLCRSKARIAAGESVTPRSVLDRLRASAERLEAAQGIAAAGAEAPAGCRSRPPRGERAGLCPRAVHHRERAAAGPAEPCQSLRVGDASPGPARQGRAPACRWT